MAKLSRRDLLKLLAWGTVGTALSSCIPKGLRPDVSPTAGEMPMPSTGTTPTAALLRNENRPGFFIRYYKPFPPVAPEQWRLSVEGMVQNATQMRLSEIQALPYVSQASRMKCVEGWSAAAKWGGFRPKSLIDLVTPDPKATWLHFYSADDYYESLSLGDFLKERVLFVYDMNDAPLLPEYGAPLRLIVPDKYGYKGPKAIIRVVFADQELRGYWPSVGPYTKGGEIQPGRDRALDLGVTRNIQEGGEIMYEDGLESEGN